MRNMKESILEEPFIHLEHMDKRFFKNWVLHIHHYLRDLLWIVRAWSLVAPIFSSLIMSRASSCVHSSQSLLKVINFLLAHIPRMNESHDLGRPFKVVITISYCFVIASNTSFWFLQEWHMRDVTIFNRIWMILLALALASSPSSS